RGLLELYTKKLPHPLEAPAAVALEGDQVVLKTTVPQGTLTAGATLHFYPLRNLVFDAFADAAVTVAGEDVTITASKHESLAAAPAEFSGLLLAETPTGGTGYIVLTGGADPAADEAATPAASTGAAFAPAPGPKAEALPFGGGILGLL